MSTAAFNEDAFKRMPVVGILRGFAVEQTIAAALAAIRGGLTTIEITMDTSGAAAQIHQLASAVPEGVNIGAGTVCSVADLQMACEAGATFVVTPVVVPDVIAAAVQRKLPIFVGAMTPSEIFAAWQAGATMVKVFPCDQLGPTYIRNVKAPLAQIPLMPTGGVTVETVLEYRKAGASAFGVGSPLFAKSRIDGGDWKWITEQAARFAAALQATS